MSNERADAWLRSIGFALTPEPHWITEGQKPDFFCESSFNCWVEVKTLDPSRETRLLDRAYLDLRLRASKLGGNGDGHALVGPSVDDAAVAAAIRYIERAIPRLTNARIPIVMIPPDPDYGRWVRLSYQCGDGSLIDQTGPAAISGSYPFYPGSEPAWQLTAEIVVSDRPAERLPAYRALNASTGKLAVRLFEASHPFRISSAGGFEATRNRSQERVREAVAEANAQLRNGQGYVPAPGLVCVYQNTMDFLAGHTLLSALFGDLTVPISRDGNKFGEAFLGRNGVFRHDKNRGVSAVRYVGYNNAETFVVNPWAEYPLAWQAFTTQAYCLLNGHTQLCSNPIA